MVTIAACKAPDEARPRDHAPTATPPSGSANAGSGAAAASAGSAAAGPKTAAAAGAASAAAPTWIQLTPALRVDREHGTVEAEGWICFPEFPLEEVVCAPGTREHESLMSPKAKPSEIHTALLLAGFKPGPPGRWSIGADGELKSEPPTGDAVEVLVRVGDAAPVPLTEWIIDPKGTHDFPAAPFLFAGSGFHANPPSMGPGEFYEADVSGNVVGLVTWGDEVIAFSRVIPFERELADVLWMARLSRLPRPDTPATLILRRPSAGAAP